ncbi:hypothetical protein WJX74_007062 [Apatococcus lobatus]|uniref:Transmembrane protein n=1 Tax=Apatococcus lobatus TaxID=904363 RepID=A0AAW1SEX4_9CHLO
MDYRPLSSVSGGDPQLQRVTSDLRALAAAQAVEAAIKKRLGALDQGAVVRMLLLALPVALAVVSFLGGLATVYASTDCKGTDFESTSRAFLYTSLARSIVAPVLSWAVGALVLRLLHRPVLAYAVYCSQAAVLAAFLVSMLVLLGLLWRRSCRSVREKVVSRLR